jgi:LmbE family N-acetylglucosaminyl deacetylase
VCLAPWDGDLHPDHEAAGRAARRAARHVLCYPVWMWHWASPADPRVPWDQALRVPLPPSAAAMKRSAIGCFASQTEDRGGGLGPVLAPGMIAHFTRAMEVLLP